ncbi:SDR family oxidoreductase [Rathayibacter sp. YIM 133350]|uniref:SDR family oxidoreductase n=1 Tax=Rathayibacter sp. YIM 133350 TaxID=3131992 RepID=UPI00307EADD7
MRVFVTGASGWVGSAVVPELIAAGHEVVGLARNAESADAVVAAGAQVHHGSLDDLDSLRAGAADADAVVHLAFKHDFSNFAESGRTERVAVETMLGELEGSDRAFLFASGVALLAPGRVVTEDDLSPLTGPDAPRGGAEGLALDYAERGVRTVSLRFAPTVHGAGDNGFLATLVEIARTKRVSAYVGDGVNRWPAAHRLDVAAMIRLALEKAPAGSRVHGVAEQGITARAIAEAIGRELEVPVASVSPADVDEHFGWIGRFFSVDMPASSAITQQLLEWTPTHPTLLEDLEAGVYTGRVRAA